jgi:hypothetical protein
MKEVFYEMLNQQLDQIRYRQLILAGNLNARMRSRNLDGIVGRFDETTVNDSEDKLINTCKQHDLRIYNIFLTKNVYRFT